MIDRPVRFVQVSRQEVTMAKVSVVIPVYNVEDYLRQCIESVLKQTLKDIEIICVDDGSTDSSLSILEEYASQDNRIKIIKQANGGAGAARNNGLRNATGDYLSFLDSDDFFEPDMLEEAYNKAEKYKADFVVFNSDQYHMDTQKFVEVPWVLRKKDIPPYMPFSYRQLTDNVFKTFVGWAWDKLYNRQFVLEHDLWFQEQRTSNDMLFVFSALVVAKRIAINDRVLAHQRRGGGASLSVTREKSWQCFYEALKALKARLVKEDIYWELEKDYVNYALHFSLWNLNSLAEPTHTMLEKKLKEEWFEELGIKGKPASYFYNKKEYEQYAALMKL
jgi:glycosyltransferase involved in cell wall biosynthesis